MEIWKPLQNFPEYEGSTEGQIRNIRTRRFLKPVIDEKGNLKVTLRRDNKNHYVKVGRVLAETFLGEHPGLDVRFKDSDKTNVCVRNLFWCTRQETLATRSMTD